MTQEMESLFAAVRWAMDAVSRILFCLSPSAAGWWDAWCDDHGRWGRFRAAKESWEA